MMIIDGEKYFVFWKSIAQRIKDYMELFDKVGICCDSVLDNYWPLKK